MDRDFVLVSRNDFIADEKLRLYWIGPRTIFKALRYYVLKAEDQWKCYLDEMNGSGLKMYNDLSLDTTVIIYHVLSS